MPFDIWHFIESVLGFGAIFVPLWYVNRRDTKKNHEQNIKRFDWLINEAAERPHHRHTEKTGALAAENIVYSPRKFNGN